MKKLMIAAAIVCAAAMSHASTYMWNSTVDMIMNNVGPAVVASATAYLIVGDTQDSLVKAMTQSGYETTVAGMASDTGSVLAGKIDVAKHDIAATLTEGQKAYFVLFTEPNHMYVSELANVAWDNLNTTYKTGFGSQMMASLGATKQASGGYVGQGWYEASAIPEPTSGLLLLLGVAGLALRRKQK